MCLLGNLVVRDDAHSEPMKLPPAIMMVWASLAFCFIFSKSAWVRRKITPSVFRFSIWGSVGIEPVAKQSLV